MPPAGAEALRAHLTRVNNCGLIDVARRRYAARLQEDIRRGAISLQSAIGNPHLRKALDPRNISHVRERELGQLLLGDLKTLTDLEKDALQALTLPIEGEESLALAATAVISRMATPPSSSKLFNFPDDGATVRILPTKPPLPLPRINDLRDLQELQVLEARRPEIKQRTARLVEAIGLLLPFEGWDPSVAPVITGLKQQYQADLAIADRASALYKKANAVALGISGREYFELPEMPTLTGPAEKLQSTVTLDRELAATQARFGAVMAKFDQLRTFMEAHALALAKGEAGNLVDPDRPFSGERDTKAMDHFLELFRAMLQHLAGQVTARDLAFRKYPITGNDILANKSRELQDLLYEVMEQNAKAGYALFDVIGANLGANDRMVGMLEKLKAFSDLSGVGPLVNALGKAAIDTKNKASKFLENTNKDQAHIFTQLKTAFSAPVELRPQVQPPPIMTPAPPKLVNPLEVALREGLDIFNQIRAKYSFFSAPELEGPLLTSPRGVEDQDLDQAMYIADVALNVRNGPADAIVIDMVKQIQRRMEKYLQTTHKLFVLEPTIGTQQPRIHDRVEVVGQETGKYGEILRVTNLGYTDADGKLVRKAKVIIGDGTVFTSKSFDTAGPARPESWSRVPPPALAVPSPGAAPATLPSSPPIPAIPRPSLGERIRGIGQRIRKVWRRVDRAMYRFQTRVVKLAVRAAKAVNSFVIKTFGPVAHWSMFSGVMRIDVYFGNNKWESGGARLIRRFFRKTSLVAHVKTEAGETVADIHKFGSTYKLITVAGHKVEIEGREFAGVMPIKSGTVIKIGERQHLIDIQPARRSFRRGRGVVQIAGGENGEAEVGNGYMLTRHAGRLHNEDAVGYIKLSRDRDLYIVADGMGGHNAGEVASQMIIEVVAREMKRGANLEQALSKASQLIEELSQKDARFHGMGSTMVATLIDRKARKQWTAWVGDSRATYIANGASWQLTRDHKGIWEAEETGIKSLAQQLPINGSRQEQIETLENDPRWEKISHVITHTVGHSKKFQGNIVEMPLASGPEEGFLLLASDGLSDKLSGKQIAELVRQGGTLQQIADRLVQAALKGGTRDNVSVVLIRVPAIDLDPDHLKEQVFGNN